MFLAINESTLRLIRLILTCLEVSQLSFGARQVEQEMRSQLGKNVLRGGLQWPQAWQPP